MDITHLRQDDAVLSVNDYAFLKQLERILTVSPDVGEAYRIETDRGRYWVWTAPDASALIDAVVYQLGAATKTFYFNNAALVSDDQLVTALLQASGKKEISMT